MYIVVKHNSFCHFKYAWNVLTCSTNGRASSGQRAQLKLIDRKKTHGSLEQSLKTTLLGLDLFTTCALLPAVTLWYESSCFSQNQIVYLVFCYLLHLLPFPFLHSVASQSESSFTQVMLVLQQLIKPNLFLCLGTLQKYIPVMAVELS